MSTPWLRVLWLAAAIYLSILALVAAGCACQTTESEATCQESR